MTMGTNFLRLWMTLLLWSLAAAPVVGQDPDPLAAARELYASARYDEALSVLDTIRALEAPPRLDRRTLEQYRSFCLIALGRTEEAELAIAAVISSDPLYRPDETSVSPRVRAAFRDVRVRLLPDLATNAYAIAKATFDRKEFAAAADQFRQVVALIDDPEMQGRLADLRTLAAGFRDLSQAAAAAPSEPAPSAAPPPAAPSASPSAASGAPEGPAGPRIYSADDAGVVPPVVVRQTLPPLPSHLVVMARSRGVLEVIIDEKGRVVSATVRSSVHSQYDTMVLTAAKDWRYQPALVGGKPVMYRRMIQISVAREPSSQRSRP
jgi:TonB family protein